MATATQAIEPTGPAVYAAICQVAAELSKDGISKNRKNTQGAGYNFRGIDDIYNALSGILPAAGLCILPRMTERLQEERASKAGGALYYVTVRAEFDFVSMRDGSKHTVTMYGEAMDSSDKATNKAMSAAYKYACLQVFCIPTEAMDDADAHTPEAMPQQKPPQPKTQPPPADAEFSQVMRHAFNNMLAKYEAANAKGAFFEELGKLGYTSIAEIPANRGLANEIMNALKLRYSDIQK